MSSITLVQKKNAVAVQGTNDSSIVSKFSMASLGYFKDDYLKHFVAKQARRAPLINRGYYIRAKAVNEILKRFLDDFSEEKKQIISLGAGFDSAFFRLEADDQLRNTMFVEVDFPDLVQRKSDLIKAETRLQSLLKNVEYRTRNDDIKLQKGVFISSSSYILLGLDLSDLSTLETYLLEVGIDFSIPTLLLSECVITYMDTTSSDALIQWAAGTFPNACFISYEQVYPSDAFGIVMMNHFKKLGSPLKAIDTYSTPFEHKERYINLGWKSCHVWNMNRQVAMTPLEEQRRVAGIEPFDEFEEWHLKCNHYILAYACSGSCQERIHQPFPDIPSYNDTRKSLQISMPLIDKSNKILRFGHSTTQLPDGHVITSGGFGDSHGRHCRLDNLQLMDLKTFEVFNIEPEDNMQHSIGPRMHHSITYVGERNLFVFGGRTSPTKPSLETLLVCFKNSDQSWTYSCPTVLNNTNSTNSEMPHLFPSLRWRHSASFVNWNDDRYVVVIGGRNLKETFCDLWVFDLGCLAWQTINSNGGAPTPRHSHNASVWQERKVVVSGGLDDDLHPLGDVFILDVGSWTWEEIDIHPAIRPRYSHSSHVIDDKLLLVGGVYLHQAVQPAVTIVCLQTGSSQKFVTVTNPERPLMLHNHTSAVLDNKTVVIIGGGGNCFSFGTHFNRSPFLLTFDEEL